jgi:transglutaminase-like putative cysteine protease
MNAALSIAWPILIAASALGRATEAWPLAGLIALLALLLAWLGERFEMDRGRQFVMSAVGAGVGYAATSVLYEPSAGHLGEGWTRLAAAALLAAVARFVLDKPAGGRAATIAIAFVGLLSVGEVRRRGGTYPLFAGAFLVASLWALRAGDPDREPGRLRPRALAMGAGVLATAALLGGLGTLSVHRMHEWMMSRAQTSSLFSWRTTGFSDQMELTALDGLLDSDSVVLRVRGPEVDYLRGAVLDMYESGRWVRSDVAEQEKLDSWSEQPGPGERVEIEAVSSHVDRFFLPLDAHQVSATPPAVKLDVMGSVKRDGRIGLPLASFSVGERDRAKPSPPTPYDLTMPKRVRVTLTSMAREWTAGTKTDEQKLDAIEQRLQRDYRYSRTFERSQTTDPTLDFLLFDKRGHCEYFATGMALLARAVGVPTRLVAGYRVAERSRFSSYRVVREKNAHAWVEAWIDGKGWTTRDPTPMDLLPQDQPHEAGVVASALDALRIGFDDLIAWLGRRTIAQTALTTLVGLGLLAWIIARGGKERRPATRPILDDEAPLPALEAFLRALDRLGFRRGDDEPLEKLAARAPDPRSAELLLEYAALRYGGVGDGPSLAKALSEHAARLADAARAPLRS